MNALIELNTSRRENYMFIDREYPMSLTLSNPRKIISRVTPSILKGLKHGTLIDVNKIIDLNTGLERGITPTPDALPDTSDVGDTTVPPGNPLPQDGAQEEITPIEEIKPVEAVKPIEKVKAKK